VEIQLRTPIRVKTRARAMIYQKTFCDNSREHLLGTLMMINVMLPTRSVPFIFFYASMTFQIAFRRTEKTKNSREYVHSLNSKTLPRENNTHFSPSFHTRNNLLLKQVHCGGPHYHRENYWSNSNDHTLTRECDVNGWWVQQVEKVQDLQEKKTLCWMELRNI
jgi:hypothetical protein